MEPMDLLHALSTAPLLQDAILKDAVTLSHQHIQGQVKLDDLRRLVLHGDAAGILTSWKGLVLSPSASVAFIVNQFTNDGEDFVVDIPTVMQLVQTQLLSVEGSGRCLVKYKLEIATGLFIVASTDFNRDDPFSDSRRELDASTLRLYIPSFAMPLQVNMPSCVHALPMDNCEALDLNTNFHALPGSHPWTADAWPAIIPQTEHVKTLRISGLGALTLAKAAVTSLERDSNAVIFPNLQDLHLYDTSFAGSYLTLSAGDMPSFCVALVLWLNLRKQHAVTPIRKLVIRECNLYAEWLAPFEQFDDLVVDWDRNVGSCRGSLDEELADMDSDEEAV
ncbi:hypothetical protein PENSPDRAFT_692373 [Peniophora sp. CONT]|nr:hypothetical protein PENSPDRAFT_692373 [Peniophora sp. CONT]